MTGQNPTTAQIAAWRDVQEQASDAAAALAPLLPIELTNPQPVLPTEPGAYQDVAGRLWWLDEGGWNNPHGTGIQVLSVTPYAPFTRLTPELTRVTRREIEALVNQWYQDGKHAPLVDGVLELVNGTGR